MDREILHPDVEGYLDGLLPARPALVAEMEREAGRSDFPIVGPHVGRLLWLLSRGIGAQRVFELGSGYGYSTYWFADAVGPGGLVVHTDFAAPNSRRARHYLGQLGLAERVRFEVGDALVALERDRGPWDVIFCDIDKAEYPDVPAVALPRLRTGGLLVFDNALWYGRVVERDHPNMDRATAAIRRLNRELHARADVMTTILPVRDGVSVSLKL